MSMSISVFLRRDRIPASAQWEESAAQAGYSLVFHEGFDPLNDSGFVPCTINGAKSGFEFFLGNVSDAELDRCERDAVGERNVVASFVWHGDIGECLCALTAAASLTRISDGMVIEEGSDGLLDSASALERMRLEIDHIRGSAEHAKARQWFGDAPPVEVATHAPGWIKCPSCGWSFSLHDQHQWSDGRHVRCGQAITPVGDVDVPNGVPVASPPPDAGCIRQRPWWRFW